MEGIGKFDMLHVKLLTGTHSRIVTDVGMLGGGALFQKSASSFPGATHTQQMSVQN
jgi:hypothetical protein